VCVCVDHVEGEGGAGSRINKWGYTDHVFSSVRQSVRTEREGKKKTKAARLKKWRSWKK
jgi:hypothetical protein